mgnify:CR=1 FL=1
MRVILNDAQDDTMIGTVYYAMPSFEMSLKGL